MEIVETVLDDITLKLCDKYDPLTKCISFMREKVHPELLALCILDKANDGEYFDPDAYWREKQYDLYYIVNKDIMILELINRFRDTNMDEI
jgi:hypothetical protein